MIIFGRIPGLHRFPPGLARTLLAAGTCSGRHGLESLRIPWGKQTGTVDRSSFKASVPGTRLPLMRRFSQGVWTESDRVNLVGM